MIFFPIGNMSSEMENGTIVQETQVTPTQTVTEQEETYVQLAKCSNPVYTFYIFLASFTCQQNNDFVPT